MALSLSITLIALDVLVLEVKISRWTRSKKDNSKVPPPALLPEGSMLILLEAAGIQKFVRRLTSEDQKHVVAPQSRWVSKRDDAVYEHCEGASVLFDRSAE